MSRHIGIVGCSAEGAALCYRTICLEAEPLMGRHAHPEITLHTIPLADYMKLIEADEGFRPNTRKARMPGTQASHPDTQKARVPGGWQGVAELMLRSAQTLERAGADFLICPDNTIHEALPFVLPRSPLPWLHIAEEVGKEAQRRGFRKLGLTGTKFLVSGPVYPEKLEQMGIGYVRPTKEQQEQINSIIFNELVRGEQSVGALFYFEQVIESFKVQGCDAVVLGCTEIPLLVTDRESPLPVLDSTRTLARAALRRALE